jgi:hypothetical protein
MKSSSGINIGSGNNCRENRKTTTSPTSSPSSAYINKRAIKANTALIKSVNVEQDTIKREEQQLNDFIQPAHSFYTTSTSSFQSESVSSKFKFQITPEALNHLNHHQTNKQRHPRVQWIARNPSLHSKTKIPNGNTSIIISSSSIDLNSTTITTNLNKDIPNLSIIEMSRKDFDDQYQQSPTHDEFDQTLKSTSIHLVTDDDDDDDDDDDEKVFIDQGSQAILVGVKPRKKIKSASHHKKIKSATKRPKQPSATQITQQPTVPASPTRTASQVDVISGTKLTTVITKVEDINAGKNSITVDTSKARSNLEVVRICLRDLGWKEVINRFFNKFINSLYLVFIYHYS